MTEYEQLVERVARVMWNRRFGDNTDPHICAWEDAATEARDRFGDMARAAIAECYRTLMEPSHNMKVRGALVWEPDEYKRADDYECGIAGETFVAMLAASPLNPEGGR